MVPVCQHAWLGVGLELATKPLLLGTPLRRREARVHDDLAVQREGPPLPVIVGVVTLGGITRLVAEILVVRCRSQRTVFVVADGWADISENPFGGITPGLGEADREVAGRSVGVGIV